MFSTAISLMNQNVALCGNGLSGKGASGLQRILCGELTRRTPGKVIGTLADAILMKKC